MGETLRQRRTIVPASLSRLFAPLLQFEKWEIHTVFLHFSNFELGQKSWLSLLVKLCGVALKPPSVNWKISTGAVEKCALCSRMRQASAASTIPSTAGAKKASDHAFHVTIFGNTGMPMVRSSRWLGNPVFLSCPLAILRVWICFCGNYPNNFRRIPFWY